LLHQEKSSRITAKFLVRNHPKNIMHPSLIPENKIHKNQAKGMNKDLKKGRIPLKHRKVLNITTNLKSITSIASLRKSNNPQE
jgi:hypothetical protein